MSVSSTTTIINVFIYGKKYFLNLFKHFINVYTKFRITALQSGMSIQFTAVYGRHKVDYI